MKVVRIFALALPLAMPAAAFTADIIVHRDPGCGCCAKWAMILKQQLGRPVRIVDDHQRALVQKRAGVPPKLISCHTAIVDGLVFEGHVPIVDMKQLLKQRPKGVKGLAVAGMPIGSPGMEVPGTPNQSFTVVAFGSGGQRLFARHGP